MGFKVGDKVRIIPNRCSWYREALPRLTIHTGTLKGLGDVFSEVVFDNNNKYTVFNSDLEKINQINQQLLFNFME